MKKSKRFGIAVCAGLLSTNVFAASKQHNQKKNSSSISASVFTKPGPKLSSQEAQALSLTAGEIIRESDLARRDLQDENLKGAKSDIGKALILVKIAERAAPKTVLETKIQSGNLSFTDKREVPNYVIPIYDELEDVSVLSPVFAAKKRAAEKQGVSSGEGPMGIGLDEEMLQTKVSLDVGLAKSQLLKAKKAVTAKKIKMADRRLERLETDVIFSYAQEDQPLLTVRANLILAKKAILSSRYQEAQAALDDAHSALEEYAKSASPSRLSAINRLEEKIKDLGLQVKNQEGKKVKSPKDVSPALTAAPNHLDLWWNKVRGWF